MNVQQSAMTAALRRSRLIPVIVIADVKNAVPLATALIDGGLPSAEITLRTPVALEALRRIRDAKPEMNAGVGTVLNVKHAKEARDAGAKFVISPGYSRAVVDYCLEHDLPVYPGLATASEIESALETGLNLFKLWPIVTLGGHEYLNLLSGPFAGVEFNPSGGLTTATFESYLALKNVVACGGSWMAQPDWIASKQFDKIRDAVRDSVARVAKLDQPARDESDSTRPVEPPALTLAGSPPG